MPEKEETTATKEKQGITVSKKKGWQKWLGRIGKFLMYGGWMLVLFLVLGIVIAVSVIKC